MTPTTGQAESFETGNQLENLPNDFPPLPPPVAAHLADPNSTAGVYFKHSLENDDVHAFDAGSVLESDSKDRPRSRPASPSRISRSPSPYRSATSSPLKNSYPDPALTLEASPLKFSLENAPDGTGGSLVEGPYSPVMEPWEAPLSGLSEPGMELAPSSSSNPLRSEPKTFSTQAINDTYQEIPIPRELKLPPLLSSRRRANNTPSLDNFGGRRRRSSANSGSILNMHSPGTPRVHNRRNSRGSTPVLLGREDSPALSHNSGSGSGSGSGRMTGSPGSGFAFDLKSPRRRRHSSSFGLKSAPRPKSALIDELPPPEWDPSPLMSELPVKRLPSNPSELALALTSPVPWGSDDPFAAVGDRGASDGYDSDGGASFRSDVATIRSELSDFERDDNYDAGPATDRAGRKSGARPKSWFSAAWQGFTKKKGERLNDGDDDGDRYNSIEEPGANTDDDLAERELGFTRFDRGLVGHHMQSVLDGSVRNTGGPVTSLIEELEIRKADRRAKREVITRDALKLQAEVKAYNQTAHPVDQAPQPTLLELQQLAEFEYLERKNWHANALSRKEFERTHETLAQRRSRVQGVRQQIDRAAAGPSVVPEQTAKFGAHETLMDRRRRLAGKKAQQSLRSQPSWSEAESISEISSLPPPQHPGQRRLRAEVSMDSTLRAVVMGYSP